MLRAATVTLAVVVVLALTVLTGFVIRVSMNKVDEKAVMDSRAKE
jgi:hypothetical protein